jgi:ribonuclease BN (tRNA processing enzyme)
MSTRSLEILLMTRRAQALAVILVGVSFVASGQIDSPHDVSSKTQIVILGTGTPSPEPDTMGPSIAIVVRGEAYIVDAGVGLVRRASAANRAGTRGLGMRNLRRIFITHLHTDHTIGLPDLIFTPWIMGRTAPLEVWGPTGTAAMIDHIVQAWSEDNDIRINGLEHGNKTGSKVVPHEIQPGVVYQDANVKVTAFLVKHGSWKQAFGYRFDTPDRSIVLSGDTSPSESVSEICNGCDVLMHEAYSLAGYATRSEAWQKYSRDFHTDSNELADLATKARPKTLILYHQMYFGGPKDTEAGLLGEIRAKYKGEVISARDLAVY